LLLIQKAKESLLILLNQLLQQKLKPKNFSGPATNAKTMTTVSVVQIAELEAASSPGL